MTYHTPSAPCQARYEIKKSEFLAFAYPINDKNAVAFHVEQLKQAYPDARHHCFAYILGDPHNTTSAGFDDDGEPNGTAGRPILNVLQHKAIGNVLVVVVRYFGGIKLGAGGLTRAYATATQMVVDKMALTLFTAKTSLRVITDFANEAQVRYLVAKADGRMIDVHYGEYVIMDIQLDDQMVAIFQDGLGRAGQVVSDKEETV